MSKRIKNKNQADKVCTQRPEVVKEQSCESRLEKICNLCFMASNQTKDEKSNATCTAAPVQPCATRPPGPCNTAQVSGKSGGGKCAAEGVVTRNPFLNYLRFYRKTHCGLAITKVAVEGAKLWNAMSDEQKWPYIVQAFRTRKRRRSSCHTNVAKRKRRITRRKIKRKCGRCGKTKLRKVRPRARGCRKKH